LVWISVLTSFIIYDSDTAYTAINDSLGLFVIVQLPSMGSRIYIHQLQVNYNELYNHENYMKFTFHKDDVIPLKFIMNVWINIYLVQLTTVMLNWITLVQLINEKILGFNSYKFIVFCYATFNMILC